MFCLFVCFGIFVPLESFMKMSPLPVKGCKFWPIYSVLMTIEQWGFFSVPNALWHEASVSSFQRTRDTHTCCWALSSWAATTWFKDSGLLRINSKTQPSACEVNALTDRATAASCFVCLNYRISRNFWRGSSFSIIIEVLQLAKIVSL